jgi:hypothetical protein
MLSNTSLIKCDDNGDPSFDLTKWKPELEMERQLDFRLLRNTNGPILSDPIENPKSFVKTANRPNSFVKVTSETYGCTETAEINLQTIPSYELATTPSTSPIVNDFSGNDNSVQLIPQQLMKLTNFL